MLIKAFWCAAAVIILWLLISNLGGGYRKFIIDDTRFAPEIKAAAAKHGLDPKLVRALIYVESSFDEHAIGKAGEIGLMQILPEGAVAEWVRVKKVPRPMDGELFKVATNLDIGCWYLSRAMKRYAKYKHATELALADYNSGASRVKTILPQDTNAEIIPRIKISSTRDYVKKIMERYEKYKSEPYI